MDNGPTCEEAGEVARSALRLGDAPDDQARPKLLGHLAFYAGWPNAFSAAPAVKDVIEKRPH